jgi:hypothetical protein
MLRLSRWSGILAVLALLTTACSPAREIDPGDYSLEFRAPLQVNSAGEAHLTLGVHNTGESAFPGDSEFNARMELRHVDGTRRAGAEVRPIGSIQPGDIVWLTDWRGQLDAGQYALTWEAPGYGTLEVTFDIVERDGRLYLGEELGGTIVEDPVDESRVDDEVALLDMAVLDLRERLGVGSHEIEIVSVEPTEFPDTSLGVPQEGEMYAQMITPGYVIRLRAGGQVYTYHGGANHVVLASQGA